jgi:phosphocarrier protein FPr/phosphocarrier protein
MLRLHSPLAGWCSPLAETPDAAFAEGMLGDGVAIDPVGSELRAPCDGEIISIAAARHAIALRANGVEILMHVGIDTVALGGDGFDVSVRKGDRVRTGDLLLRFDLPAIARRAPSLVTPVIVTNGAKILIARVNHRVAIGDPLMDLEDVAVGSAAHPVTAPVVSEQVVVAHAHGIHARPAALIARGAKALPYRLEIRARGRSADPRSAVALMSLGIRGGDELVIAGFEPAAEAGVAELARIVRALANEPHGAYVPSAPRPQSALAPAPRPAPALGHAHAATDPTRLAGVIASRGLVAGRAFQLHDEDMQVAETAPDSAAEIAALERARDRVRESLRTRATTASRSAREILEAHLELLDDEALTQAAEQSIDSGKSAGHAWRAAIRTSASALEATGDARLAERVADLRDLERQVLLALAGKQAAAIAIPADAILVAKDLTPSQLIDIDASRLGGIALAAGGATSHVAILAGTLGVPMLVALGADALAPSGTELLLDAETGTLRIAPSPAERDEFSRRLATRREREIADRAAAARDCRLASGERIEIFANLAGSVADARKAVEMGAEGCGLLRTEFLFMDRDTPPDEGEQLECYDAVARELDGRPLVIRTFDVGGDKPISYLPLPAEENPALGLRGIRASLWRPAIFRVQLRALLRAAGDRRILLPMITDVAEVRAVRAMLAELCAETGAAAPPLGVMIETPAAALLAGSLAREADFLSIGTNDLSQYTLAMDRGNAELAARVDAAHPAVLKLIGAVCDAAALHGKPVAVCGGLASDPAAVPLLIGLGVTELSAVPAMIPRLKAVVGSITLNRSRELARRALDLEDAAAVRASMNTSGETP